MRRWLIVGVGALVVATLSGVATYMAGAVSPDFIAACLADDYAAHNGGAAFCEGELALARRVQLIVGGAAFAIALLLTALALTVVTALWDV